MVVMIRGALFVMRVARSVMIVIVVMLMLVRGGDKIAGVDRKGSAVHADEHAENHNDLEKDSHVDAPQDRRHGRGVKSFQVIEAVMDGARAWPPP